MAPKLNTTKFSLPYEILQHILSFGVVADKPEMVLQRNNLGQNMMKEFVRFVANFQSLNKKITELPEMEMYFDEFWWNVWEIWFGNNHALKEQFNILKEDLIKKKQLKRKVLMARYIKYTVLRSPTRDSNEGETKVVVIGKGGVGKTSITVQFSLNVFVDRYDARMEDTYRKELKVDGVPAILEIWDTPGQEEYSAMRDQFMRIIGECFVLVCDLTDNNSLEEAEHLVEQLIRIKDMETNEFPIVFALNKVDFLPETDRKLTIEKFTSRIQSIIERNQLTNTFITYSSAKTKENIDIIFEECVRRKRYGTIDNLTLLQEIAQHDSSFIETCKKQRKITKHSNRNCSLM